MLRKPIVVVYVPARHILLPRSSFFALSICFLVFCVFVRSFVFCLFIMLSLPENVYVVPVAYSLMTWHCIVYSPYRTTTYCRNNSTSVAQFCDHITCTRWLSRIDESARTLAVPDVDGQKKTVQCEKHTHRTWPENEAACYYVIFIFFTRVNK